MARSLLHAISDFSLRARNLDKKLVGNLNIGMIGQSPLSQNSRISKAIARFRQRDEAVKLTILIRSPIELEGCLLNGTLDIAIGYFWRRVPSLHFTPLFVERQVAYCGKNHPLYAQAGNLSPDEVRDYDSAWRTYPLPEAQLFTPPQRMTAATDNMEALAMLILWGIT
ncbi:LysR substrate-binding domain-containing protein [Azospirillum sp. A29]|uniref:LysR substrate-binding domain-containing protein n=1 Tax=Azospirillum sp. A29 TaxID=3160606 RepID=UPI00366EC489